MLNEDEHPLVTPAFIGTDQEKIDVLSYWTTTVGMLRSMNSTVVSHENKLSIINQLKKELELIDLEVNNATSHPAQKPDGSPEMTQDVPTDEPDNTVDLSSPEVISPSGAPAPARPTAQKSSLYAPPKMSVTEQMQRLAGTWYINKAAEAAAKKNLPKKL